MIKSEKKEYLLEFSKIDIEQELDLTNEKNRLIELKSSYDIYKESELFLEAFKKEVYKIDIYMDNKCSFIVASQKDLKGDDIRYCFSLEYKLNEENVLLNFLTGEISLEYLLEIIKNLIFENFLEIKFNLIRDLIIKDVLYWCDQLDKYPFLIYIVNIEDFYNFIGRYVFFDYTNKYECVQYSRFVDLMHYKIGYASNNTGSLTTFIKERSKEKDLYAKLIYNQYYNEEFEDFDYKIGSFLIYAIYNNLIPNEKIDAILRIKSNFLFKFLVESFYTKEEVLNKILSYVSKDNPFEYRCNIKGIQNLTLIPQIIYNIEIDKGYFRENGSEILLEITKSLILGNKIKIGTNLVRYHLEKEVLLKHLLENINVLLKVFNITREEFEKVISENLL